MKNPIVLTVDPIGGSVEPETVLYPQKMQLNLRTDGQSACTMTLAPECEDVAIGKIVQLWAPNGDTCIMYVKSRNRDYATGIQTLTLEHVFGLLKDMIVFGEITPPDMTGTATDTTIAVEDAIEYLLGQQTAEYFELYVCDFDDEEGWKFTNSDIYSALNSIADSIENCQWDFDFSSFPWSISLVEIPSSSEVDMEMRKDRNISNLKVNIDRSQMYTRAYPTGKNDLHIDSVNSDVSYVDYNTGEYGIICKVITDSTISDAALLKKWAKKQVKKNSVPKITVTVDGYELSNLTGESLDHFRTGLRCRIPIPDMLDDPIVERMTELSWSDCVSAPNHVTCTLANDLKTITGIIFEQVAQSRGAGSRKANTEHDNELGKHSSAIIQNIKLEGPTNNIFTLQYQKYGNDSWDNANPGALSFDGIIMGVRITGPVNNVYTLEYQKYGSDAWIAANPGNFSRAVANVNWSWSNGTITVTPMPQNQDFTLGMLSAGTKENVDGTPYTAGNLTWRVPINFAHGQSGQYIESTGWYVYVDASGIDAASGSASGRHGTSYDWDFLITRGDGTTKTLTIDCSLIYSDARVGYTQGTYVSAGPLALQGTPTTSLTLEGTPHDVTPIKANSGVQLGASKTVYKQGSSFRVQGSAGPKLYHWGTHTLKNGSTDITQDWYYVSNSSSAEVWYHAGTSSKYEAVSDGSAMPVVSSGGTNYYQADTLLHLFDKGADVGILYNPGEIRNDLYVKTS